MTVKQLLKAGLFMSLRHLPFSVAMVAVTAAAIAGFIFFPIALVVLPVLSTFVNSLLMERILKKYVPKSEETEEGPKKDEWYLE